MQFKKPLNIILFVLICYIPVNSQWYDNKYGLYISANYTTESRIFLSPNASEEILREINFPVSDIYSYAVELRYRVSKSVIIGLGTEFIQKVSKERDMFGFPSQLAGMEIEEGFRMIPVEGSLYYFLPFSTERFKFFMGGGLGIYFGEHIRKFADIDVRNTDREFAWGIHGRIGMDYALTRFFSLRAEMKFRDPEFEMQSEYSKDSFIHEGQQINLPSNSFPSKVNIIGMTFSLGTVIHF